MKTFIVGAGHCEKLQIRMMVEVLLPTGEPKSNDAADALAVAVAMRIIGRRAILKMRGSNDNGAVGSAMIGKL